MKVIGDLDRKVVEGKEGFRDKPFTFCFDKKTGTYK